MIWDIIRAVGIGASLIIAMSLPWAAIKPQTTPSARVRFASSFVLAFGLASANATRFGEVPVAPFGFCVIHLGIVLLAAGHLWYYRDKPRVQPTRNIYQDRLANIPATFIVADEFGRIITASGMAEHVIGWRVNDLVGHPLVSIIPEDQRAAHFAGMERARAGEPIGVTGKMMHVDVCTAKGNRKPIQLTVLPLEKLDESDTRRFLGIIISEDVNNDVVT